MFVVRHNVNGLTETVPSAAFYFFINPQIGGQMLKMSAIMSLPF
jgi:hypothetical protein